MSKQQWAGRVLRAVVLGAAVVLLVRRMSAARQGRAPVRALTRRPGPVTQALVPVTPADAWLGEPGHNEEQRLDEALQETFPGSDPIATHIE
jgi:hypothetical protein